jgi:hypothetical protein
VAPVQCVAFCAVAGGIAFDGGGRSTLRDDLVGLGLCGWDEDAEGDTLDRIGVGERERS